ncbi:MAG: hypothetical protein JXA91_08105 [Candidatus Thermoplasmatota archaeon]|nr:hypothetical protein [Candidatus Thermoplasmatota archaeon]
MKIVRYSLKYLKVLLQFGTIFIVFEIVFRCFINSPSKQMHDENFGWRYHPNVIILHTSEGFSRIKLNSDGFNDDEEIDGMEKKQKIFVFGDSYVEALQVSSENNFCSILEKINDSISFQNMGKSDFSPLHYIILLNFYREKIPCPSMFVVVLNDFDIDDILKQEIITEKDSIGVIKNIRIGSFDESDNLKNKMSFLYNNSALCTFLFRKYSGLVLESARKLQNFKDRNEKCNQYIKDYNEAKKRIKYILSQIQMKGELLIVYIPKLNYRAGGVAEIADRSVGNTYRKIAEELNVKYMNMEKIIKEEYSLSHKPPVGFNNSIFGTGHLNKNGHILLANTINDIINREDSNSK